MKSLTYIIGVLCSYVSGWFFANHFTHGTSLLYPVPFLAVGVACVIYSLKK